MTKSRDRCPCGGIILADTEDWDVPLCYSCFTKFCSEVKDIQAKNIRIKQQLAQWQEQASLLIDAAKNADQLLCGRDLDTDTLRDSYEVFRKQVKEFEAFKASSEGENE